MGWSPPTAKEIASLEESEFSDAFDSWPCLEAAREAKVIGDADRELSACLYAILRRSDTPYLYERASLLLEKNKNVEGALAVCNLWFALPQRERGSGGTTERKLLKRRNRLLQKLGRPEVDLSDPASATNFEDWVRLRAPAWTSYASAATEVKEAMTKFTLTTPDLWSSVIQFDATAEFLLERKRPREPEAGTHARRAADILWEVYVQAGGSNDRDLSDSFEDRFPWNETDPG